MRTSASRVSKAMKTSQRLDITHLLAQIELLTQTIAQLDKQIERKLHEHPDAQVFDSLPVKGTNTIATLLAGFGEDRETSPGHRQLAAAWGVAPLTIQSGKHRSVRRRHTADHTLSQSLMHFAFNTAFTADCWASTFYQRKRAEGKAHYTALRCLAQRWLKILHRMWIDRVPYDEKHHQNNQQHPTHRNPATSSG